MPAKVKVPKTSGRVNAATHLQQRKPTTYSLGEETFDSILAIDSLFAKQAKREGVDSSANNEAYKDEEDVDNDDDFDPFRIGDSSRHTTTNAAVNDIVSITSEKTASTTGLIPPKMLVRFKIHEEVSSVSSRSKDGTSQVFVHGTIQAQIVSSDALKNSPFILHSSIDNGEIEKFELLGTEPYTKEYTTKRNSVVPGKNAIDKPEKLHLVKIPKETVGFVTVGTYTCIFNVEHLPSLLEQKVVRKKSNIQVAVQVRSKLTNPDDMRNFSIVVSFPPRVNSDSVAIVAGDGGWDRTKRCVKWEVVHLPKGQSFMVSAKGALDDTSENPQTAESNDGLDFPVMLRCCSNDRISALSFEALQANGYPATVSSSIVGQSFRIIHRLQNLQLTV